MVPPWRGEVEVDEFSVSGNVFTNGALRGGARKGTERNEWSMVLVDHDACFVGSTCPDFFPTSPTAELWVVLQALRHAVPLLTLWVDNKGGFDRVINGPKLLISYDV